MAPAQSISQSINHLQQTSYLLYEKFDWMYVSFTKANIWFQTSVLLNHMCIPPPLRRRSVFAVFSLLFIVKCSTLVLFTNLTKCKEVGLLNGTPRFFFFFFQHGSFCMKKKKSLF